MLTHSMLLRILVEAEARRDNQKLSQDVRNRSAETASLCNQRMAIEGLSRNRLEQLARIEV